MAEKIRYYETHDGDLCFRTRTLYGDLEQYFAGQGWQPWGRFGRLSYPSEITPEEAIDQIERLGVSRAVAEKAVREG